MNRRQKAVVVLGVAAVVLLVLFPPWYDTYLLGEVRLRWVGSDPIVVEEVTERIAYWHEHVNKYSRPGDATKPDLRFDTRRKRVHHEYAISYGLAAGGMLAALVLTVVAVHALKSREV